MSLFTFVSILCCSRFVFQICHQKSKPFHSVYMFVSLLPVTSYQQWNTNSKRNDFNGNHYNWAYCTLNMISIFFGYNVTNKHFDTFQYIHIHVTQTQWIWSNCTKITISISFYRFSKATHHSTKIIMGLSSWKKKSWQLLLILFGFVEINTFFQTEFIPKAWNIIKKPISNEKWFKFETTQIWIHKTIPIR